MNLPAKKTAYTVALEDALFTLVPLTASERIALTEEFAVRVLKEGRYTEELDRRGFGLAVWTRQLQGWENVKREGEALACDDAGKEWFWDHANDLVARVLVALDATVEAARKEREKN